MKQPSRENALPHLSAAEVHAGLALVYTAAVLTTLEYWFHPSRVEARITGVPAHSMPAPSMEAGPTWSAATVAAA